MIRRIGAPLPSIRVMAQDRHASARARRRVGVRSGPTYRLSWSIVHTAFAEAADALLAEPSRVVVLGIAMRFGAAGRPGRRDPITCRWRHTERFKTTSSISPAIRGYSGRPRAAPSSRSPTDSMRAQDWKNSVQIVAMGPCAV